jgi:hypothetical protein
MLMARTSMKNTTIVVDTPKLKTQRRELMNCAQQVNYGVG